MDGPELESVAIVAREVNLEHLTSSQKGDYAQTQIMAELCRLGMEVLVPQSAACRYDLAIANGTSILRVQCKLARVRGRAVVFWTTSSTRQRRGQWVRYDYSSECDLLVCYCPETGGCYALSAAEAPLNQVNLHLGNPANGQTAGIRLAEDYELANVLKALQGEV